MDWFTCMSSNAELAEIVSDYSKDVYGFRTRMHGAGRCSLVRQLELLDAHVKQYGFGG